MSICTITTTAQQKVDTSLLKNQINPSVKTIVKKNAVQQSTSPVSVTKPVTIKNNITSVITSTPIVPVQGTATDIDGNVYRTLQIGTQVWMIENLKTTRLNDGTAIVDPAQYLISKNYFGLQASSFPNGGWGVDVVDPNNHSQYVLKSTNPAYCIYNNLPSNKINYGNLYNWFAVNSGKLAPSGWHVPTDAEWDILLRYVADFNNNNLPYFNSGGNLKSVGGWNSPNTGATNKSGFAALAGGYRSSATFNGIGDQAYFWSSTPRGQYEASAKNLSKGSSGLAVVSGNISLLACSVRCIKN